MGIALGCRCHGVNEESNRDHVEFHCCCCCFCFTIDKFVIEWLNRKRRDEETYAIIAKQFDPSNREVQIYDFTRAFCYWQYRYLGIYPVKRDVILMTEVTSMASALGTTTDAEPTLGKPKIGESHSRCGPHKQQHPQGPTNTARP